MLAFPAWHTRADTTDIAILGDSVALGIGAWPQPGYTQILGQMTGLRVRVFGHVGETSSDFLRHGHLEEALAAGSSVVIVGIGGNDLLQLVDRDELASQALARLEANVDTLLARLAPSGTRIILLGIYNPLPERHVLRKIAERVLPAANRRLERLAAKYGAFFLSLEDVLGDRSEQLTRIRLGDVHPTAEGHKRIAEALLPLIRDAPGLLRLSLVSPGEIVYAQTVALPGGTRLSWVDAVYTRLLLHVEAGQDGRWRASGQVGLRMRHQVGGEWWAGIEVVGLDIRMKVSRMVLGTVELALSEGAQGWALEMIGWLSEPWELFVRLENAPSKPAAVVYLRMPV